MRRYLPLLMVSFMSSCAWMSSDTASLFARDDVLSDEEARGYLNTAIAINTERCATLYKPALHLIDTGYDHILSRPFYYKDSLDVCFTALLLTPCPESELSDDDAVHYYRMVLNACDPRPYEL